MTPVLWSMILGKILFNKSAVVDKPAVIYDSCIVNFKNSGKCSWSKKTIFCYIYQMRNKNWRSVWVKPSGSKHKWIIKCLKKGVIEYDWKEIPLSMVFKTLPPEFWLRSEAEQSKFWRFWEDKTFQYSVAMNRMGICLKLFKLFKLFKTV